MEIARALSLGNKTACDLNNNVDGNYHDCHVMFNQNLMCDY